MENAQKRGIDLSNVAIVYSGPTEQEAAVMEREHFVTHADPSHGTVIARFKPAGMAAFPKKATALLAD